MANENRIAKFACILLVAGCLCSSFAISAFAQDQSVSSPANAFITLGTAGGPEAEADRSQPANALVLGEAVYLVDAGDGTAGQLKKAGIRLPQVKGLFISHNHFDHTGGVLAVLGLRMQLNVNDTLTIYGPPGTQAFIDGLLAGMEPARLAAYGMPGQEWQANVEVTEVSDGSVLELDGFSVTVAENTHFSIPENSGVKEKAKALSFRFDLENRSIVYTGDTGPSEAVARLAANADLLVSEMMDIPAVLAFIRKVNPNMPQQQLDKIEWHFRAHHLLPEQVGDLAAAAEVKHVAITHMVPNISNAAMADHYKAIIGERFKGEISIASDLDRF